VRIESGNHRIVVDLKGSSDVERTVSAAATLAIALRAELHGLFTEEESLHDLARLPFSCAVAPGRAMAERLSPDTMFEAIQRQLKTSRRILSSTAEDARLKWSFVCERGRSVETINSTVNDEDFVVLAHEGQIVGPQELLNQLNTILARTRGVVVMLERRQVTSIGPVIAVVQNDESSLDAIELGSRIAAVLETELILFALVDNEMSIGQLSDRIGDRVHAKNTPRIYRFSPGADGQLATALRELRPRFVVSHRSVNGFADDRSAMSLLRAAKSPVLLLRNRDG